MVESWCYWHTVTEDHPDELTCLAHMHEARVFRCQYKSAEDSQNREYPCEDYKAGQIIRAQEAAKSKAHRRRRRRK